VEKRLSRIWGCMMKYGRPEQFDPSDLVVVKIDLMRSGSLRLAVLLVWNADSVTSASYWYFPKTAKLIEQDVR
jgi:hypothetical protein